MLHMREQLLSAVKAHAQGEIAKHRANVNVYLEHPAGLGEHSDITEAIHPLMLRVDEFVLKRNYRSHQAILDLCQSITDVLTKFFKFEVFDVYVCDKRRKPCRNGPKTIPGRPQIIPKGGLNFWIALFFPLDLLHYYYYY